MKLMPIGGKNGSGNAQAVSVNTVGSVGTEHIWADDVVKIVDAVEIRDTEIASYPSEPLDTSGYAVNSLRVINTLGKTLTMIFCDDVTNTGGRWASDASGGVYQLTIPASSLCMVITPEDIPYLNYLHKITIKIKALEAPESGYVSVYLVRKR